MKYRITATTDRQHLGYVFDHKANPILLSNGIKVPVERTIVLPNNGMRFINSNYIIDSIKV